jgi:hypothetical protein
MRPHELGEAGHVRETDWLVRQLNLLLLLLLLVVVHIHLPSVEHLFVGNVVWERKGSVHWLWRHRSFPPLLLFLRRLVPE